MVMASKKLTEEIWVQENDVKRQLDGEELATFISNRAQIQLEIDTQQAEQELKKELKKSAYTKLGLTKEEIDAIL
jgi:hypothetical protein